MKLVDYPTIHPSQCALTRVTTPGPFVDTEVDLEHEGRFYLHLNAIEEIAKAAGYLTLHQAAALQELVHAQEQELRDKDRELERLRKLEESIAYTLKHGATANRGTVELRGVPGRPRRERELQPAGEAPDGA